MTENPEKRVLHEEIANRAYEIYLKTSEEGRAVEHWLAAEEELRQGNGNAPSKTEDVTEISDPAPISKAARRPR